MIIKVYKNIKDHKVKNILMLNFFLYNLKILILAY